MIPSADSFLNTLETVQEPIKTWRLDTENNKLNGMITDASEAARQAVFLVLATEAGNESYIDYGRYFNRLIGTSPDYAAAEIEREVRESILMDARFNAVEDFVFEKKGRVLSATFKSVLADGSTLNSSVEVRI